MEIRETSKWTWIDVVKKGFIVLHLNEMTLNRAELVEKIFGRETFMQPTPNIWDNALLLMLLRCLVLASLAHAWVGIN